MLRMTGVGSVLAGILLLAVAGLAAGSPVANRWGGWSSGTGAGVDVDLDADGDLEQVVLGTGRGGIAITDGETRYESRPRWWVTTATIADVDRNGLPEIAALLDADDGRHLGLVGWHMGAYRERLVSSVLPLRTVTLEAHDDPNLGGWVVVLTEALPAGSRRIDPDAALLTTTYRWNGFGFIAIAGEGAVHDGDSRRQP